MTHGLWTNNLELLHKSLIKKTKKKTRLGFKTGIREHLLLCVIQRQCCSSKQDCTWYFSINVYSENIQKFNSKNQDFMDINEGWYQRWKLQHLLHIHNLKGDKSRSLVKCQHVLLIHQSRAAGPLNIFKYTITIKNVFSQIWLHTCTYILAVEFRLIDVQKKACLIWHANTCLRSFKYLLLE